MSAVLTARECEEYMKGDLFREVGRAPEESGYARLWESPLHIRVYTHITRRGDEYPGPGARLRIRIEGHDGRLIAESEDADIYWFEEHLP